IFNTHRMVKEYTERLYLPAARSHENFAQNGCEPATQLSIWKSRMRKDWPQVRINDVQVANQDRQNILVGESLQVSAYVSLGDVDPNHVRVEPYHAEAENGGIKNPSVTVLNASGRNGDGIYIYQGSVPAGESGAYGFSVRGVPRHSNIMQAHGLRLIAWSLFTASRRRCLFRHDRNEVLQPEAGRIFSFSRRSSMPATPGALPRPLRS